MPNEIQITPPEVFIVEKTERELTSKEKAYESLYATTPGRAVLAGRRAAKTLKKTRAIENTPYSFTDRSKGHDKMCMILAGYKQPLWNEVFGRLKAILPGDVDVCIMTSGLVNEQLQGIAEENGWSYLSTAINHLSVVQNICIDLHPKAEWIYKMDEDMFLTAGFFETMMDTYLKVLNDSPWVPAFVSPLINVSTYGHLRLLEKCDLVEDFRSTGLSTMKYAEGLCHNVGLIKNPDVAKYMWGESQPVLQDIDALSAKFGSDPLDYTICPFRYSIGAILFARQTWFEFDRFPLTSKSSPFGLGDDEEYICKYACLTGRVIVVSENNVAGHLGYGPQTKAMTDYYLANKEKFALNK